MQILCQVPELDPFLSNFCSPFEEIAAAPLTEMDYGLEGLDVEGLLGVGLDEVKESSFYGMDGFGGAGEEDDDAGRIKMELDFDAVGDCLASLTAAEEGITAGGGWGGLTKMGLRLDYDAVIEAWTRSGGCSLWGGGGPPDFDAEGTGLPPSFTGMSSEGTTV